MEVNRLKNTWPLQRLKDMVSHAQNTSKESWKDLPVLSSSFTEENETVQSGQRDEAVAWMAKVNVKFHFQHETFFIATNILDRFISLVKAQSKYLKCIGITCLYLASKVSEEEDVIPCTGELVRDSDCGCSVRDVLRMERIILDKLSWGIYPSTALDYLHIFQLLSFVHYTDMGSRISLSRHMTILSAVLIKLLCHYEIARFSDAAIALALIAVELENYTSSPVTWTCVARKLQGLVQVSTDELMTCRESLLHHLPQRVKKRLEECSACIVKNGPLQEHRDSTGKVPVALTPAVLQSGSSGAVKRKAAAPSSTKLKAHSKKPHPEAAVMTTGPLSEVNFQETLTQKSKGEEAVSRRLTYAEIVKYGQDCKTFVKPTGDAYNTSCVSNPNGCSFEASHAFGSMSSDTHIQCRIKI